MSGAKAEHHSRVDDKLEVSSRSRPRTVSSCLLKWLIVSSFAAHHCSIAIVIILF